MSGEAERDSMKYLTMSQILQPCLGQGWAVGAYDTCNLEITQAIVDAWRPIGLPPFS